VSGVLGQALEREAFEAFPYPMLVLDREGRVLRANAEAIRLIGQLRPPDEPLTCCALFGCGAAGSPLAGSRLARTLMDGGDGAAAELRAHLVTPAGRLAVSLVVARLASERIAVQVRPAVACSMVRVVEPFTARRVAPAMLGDSSPRPDRRGLVRVTPV
jgi:PAS domain-containing protein